MSANGVGAFLLDVTLNGQRADEPVLVYRRVDGILELPKEALRAWHLRIEGMMTVDHEGVASIALTGPIGVSCKVDSLSQTLAIISDANGILPTTSKFHEDTYMPMTKSGYGGFLNYDILGEISSGRGAANGAFEAGAFTPHGVGVTSFVVRAASGQVHAVRLESNWTIDDPWGMRSVRIGDGVSGSASFSAPLRFAGVQIARNFTVDSGYITFPLPSVSGSAALPSVADIYIYIC